MAIENNSTPEISYCALKYINPKTKLGIEWHKKLKYIKLSFIESTLLQNPQNKSNLKSCLRNSITAYNNRFRKNRAQILRRCPKMKKTRHRFCGCTLKRIKQGTNSAEMYKWKKYMATKHFEDGLNK